MVTLITLGSLAANNTCTVASPAPKRRDQWWPLQIEPTSTDSKSQEKVDPEAARLLGVGNQRQKLRLPAPRTLGSAASTHLTRPALLHK